jgi:hypothetical protein
VKESNVKFHLSSWEVDVKDPLRSGCPADNTRGVIRWSSEVILCNDCMFK